MKPIEQARQYLADKGKTLWSDADIRPMVEGLLAVIESQRKGEFICDSCYLRKDGESQDKGF